MATSSAHERRHSAHHGVWGVTCFFNPNRSQRRLENYRTFRRSLIVPLVTVELAFGPQPELGREDADILIPLRGKDVLWQKERLLNLALQALPADCDTVAWLDGDILFERTDWPALVRAELEHAVLVQPFQDVIDLKPASEMAEDKAPAGRQSLAHKVAVGGLSADLIATARLRNEGGCAAGLAWAGRRDALQRHGLYDAAIIGGGDRAIACAAYGSWHGLERTHQMNAQQQRHYLAWAQSFHETVQGRIGWVPGTVRHLWHGSIDRRRYGTRFAGLAPFGFDPHVDIALDDQGCWRWNSDKTDLDRYVRSYFEQRDEDA